MTMDLFLDTEFTSLKAPRLISLALVAESGEHIYVEVDDWWAPTKFVRHAVLPLLTGPRLTRAEAGRAVRSFLEACGPSHIWTDSPIYDGPLLRDLVGDAPSYVLKTLGANSVKPGVYEVMDLHRYQQALEAEFAKGTLRRHHALDDAKASCAAWQATKHTIKRHKL